MFPVRTTEVTSVTVPMPDTAVLVPVKSGLALHEHFECAVFAVDKVHDSCALSGSNPLDCMHIKTDAPRTSVLMWCGQRDSNPHGLPHGPEPCASANSAMTARIEQSYYTTSESKMQRKFCYFY